MSAHREHLARLRNELQRIQNLALQIDSDTKASPDSRHYARVIMTTADDIHEQLIALFRGTSPEEIRAAVAEAQQDKNGHLGAEESRR